MKGDIVLWEGMDREREFWEGKSIRIGRWVDGLTHSDMNFYFTLRINMCNKILNVSSLVLSYGAELKCVCCIVCLYSTNRSLEG